MRRCRLALPAVRAATSMVAVLLATSPVSAQTPPAPRDIAARARPSVVLVAALDGSGAAIGQGSGFFVRRDGTLVTNYHVIEDASALQVQLSDGEVYDNVFLVTLDVRRDLAVLKIPVDGASALGLGSDRDLEVGDRVYVLGNPLGLEGTFSDGLVSGKRLLEGTSYVQISAPISPGSSGGPVMDDRGNVIGVATLSVTEGQNLNLAVPVRYVRPLLETGEQPRRFSADLLPDRPMAYAPGGQGAAGGAATAEDAWIAQVRQQLEYQVRMFRDEGFSETHDPYVGNLDDDESETLTVALDAGVEYMITGVCDNDCSDLDLAAYAPGGSKLAEDVEVDDVPMLRVVAQQTGTHRVQISMANCSANPCRFGVAVFARQAGAQAGGDGGADTWLTQVRRQIQYQTGMFAAENFRETHDPFLGTLRDDQSETLSIQLQSGREYMITGVCDNDCSDLDLAIYAPGGSKLAEDVETDDVPMMRISAHSTGTYRVVVSMATCSVEPCRYGVAVFAR